MHFRSTFLSLKIEDVSLECCLKLTKETASNNEQQNIIISSRFEK